MTGRSRIVWDDTERTDLGMAVWNEIRPQLETGTITLKQALGGYRILPALKMAQNTLLPPDRRRKIISVTGTMKWLPKMIRDRALKMIEQQRAEQERAEAERLARAEREQQVSQPVDQDRNGQVTEPVVQVTAQQPSTPGQMLDSLLGMIGGALTEQTRGITARLEGLEAATLLLAETFHQLSTGKTDSHSQPLSEILKRIRNPKFVIVGLNKGTQTTEVERQFEDAPVKLGFQGSDTNKVPGGDRVFVMNKFIDHSTVERLITHVGKDRLVFVDGGVGDLCHAIRSRLPKTTLAG
jgi:hypothetical protein